MLLDARNDSLDTDTDSERWGATRVEHAAGAKPRPRLLFIARKGSHAKKAYPTWSPLV